MKRGVRVKDKDTISLRRTPTPFSEQHLLERAIYCAEERFFFVIPLLRGAGVNAVELGNNLHKEQVGTTF